MLDGKYNTYRCSYQPETFIHGVVSSKLLTTYSTPGGLANYDAQAHHICNDLSLPKCEYLTKSPLSNNTIASAVNLGEVVVVILNCK